MPQRGLSLPGASDLDCELGDEFGGLQNPEAHRTFHEGPVRSRPEVLRRGQLGVYMLTGDAVVLKAGFCNVDGRFVQFRVLRLTGLDEPASSKQIPTCSDTERLS